MSRRIDLCHHQSIRRPEEGAGLVVGLVHVPVAHGWHQAQWRLSDEAPKDFFCLQQSLYWVQYRSTQQERSAIAAIASPRGHRLVRLVFGYVLAIPGAGLVLDVGPAPQLSMGLGARARAGSRSYVLSSFRFVGSISENSVRRTEPRQSLWRAVWHRDLLAVDHREGADEPPEHAITFGKDRLRPTQTKPQAIDPGLSPPS